MGLGDGYSWLVLGSVGSSFLVSLLATGIVRRRAERWGLLDRPGGRKAHIAPTPLGGGLAIGAGVILPLAVGYGVLGLAEWWPSLGERLPSILRLHADGLWYRAGGLGILLLCALTLLVLGLADDVRGIDWRIRLGMQFAVSLFGVLTQGWRLTAFIELPTWGWLVSVGLSVFWIVALINAFNMLDNMDGLSAGVAAISSALLAGVLMQTGSQDADPQLFVAGFLLVLVGALLGFLWHNRPPARIFMGDAGSYFVGFCVAVATLLATYTTYDDARPHAILAPLCVMAVPLYDMMTVVVIRLRAGRSPFDGDRNHFSHRLVDLGLSKGQAVLTIYLTTATCGLGALLLNQVNFFGAVVILLMVLAVLALIAILEMTARRKLKS